MLALGIAAAGVLHVVLAALLAILATVRSGDPFTLVNAARLRAIGWALLALQLLDLGMGGIHPLARDTACAHAWLVP